MATATYPSAIVTDAALPDVGDRLPQVTTLNEALDDSETSIDIVDGTNFVASSGFVVIDSEVILYGTNSSNTLSSCTRGALGSTAAAHNNGAVVLCGPIGRIWDQMAEEIKAIETELGTDAAGTYTDVKTRLNDQTAGVLLFRTEANVDTGGTTHYIGGSSGTQSATEGAHQVPMPFDCRLRNLHIQHSAAAAGTKAIVYTVRKNGSDTALTATVTDPATSASDTSNTVAFSQGDLVSLSIAPDSAIAALKANMSLEIVVQ